MNNIIPFDSDRNSLIFPYTDASGKQHFIDLNEDSHIEAMTRAGKTTFSSLLSRFGSNNWRIPINICKNTKAQAADWELKHQWHNSENKRLWVDTYGQEHEFLTENATSSKNFTRDLCLPGTSCRIYHALKNDRSLGYLEKCLEENKSHLKRKSILLFIDEAHHALHKENRNKAVVSNEILWRILDNFEEFITVMGLTASGNVVRDKSIWKKHYFLQSREDTDLIKDTRQFYVPEEDLPLWRHQMDGSESIVPESVTNFIVRQEKRPGICLVLGQRQTSWQDTMSKHILENTQESVVLEVNKSKYTLITSCGESELKKDEEGKKIESIIAAIELVFGHHSDSKIYVVTHAMGYEGESYRNAIGSTVLTGFIWCPAKKPVDEVAQQSIGRIEIQAAEDNGWTVEICAPEQHFKQTVAYTNDSIQKAIEKSEGREYSQPHYRSTLLTSSMKNKGAEEEGREIKKFDAKIYLKNFERIPVETDVDQVWKSRESRKLLKELRQKGLLSPNATCLYEGYDERYIKSKKPHVLNRDLIYRVDKHTVIVITSEYRKNNPVDQEAPQ